MFASLSMCHKCISLKHAYGLLRSYVRDAHLNMAREVRASTCRRATIRKAGTMPRPKSYALSYMLCAFLEVYCGQPIRARASGRAEDKPNELQHNVYAGCDRASEEGMSSFHAIWLLYQLHFDFVALDSSMQWQSTLWTRQHSTRMLQQWHGRSPATCRYFQKLCYTGLHLDSARRLGD